MSFNCIDSKADEGSAVNEDRPNLLLILGILAGVILLMMILSIYVRIKACQTSSRHENSQPPDATYADLVKSEVSNDYDILKCTVCSVLTFDPQLYIVTDKPQRRMSITKEIIIFTLFQGLLPGLLCQRWEFPTEIDGLIGSCVEIPCTFYPAENSGSSNTVWYLYSVSYYLQIFNSRSSSSILMDYNGRTSLVRGRDSCSLRIDPVREDDGEEYYYPGIAERVNTNAWTRSHRAVVLHVTDTPRSLELIGRSIMHEGIPETMKCSVVHTCGSSPPSLKWNKPGQTERQYEALSGGYWREISLSRYIPSHEDDKTQIQCTVTYHNGITLERTATLNIKYAPKDVTVSLPEDKEFLEGSDVTLTCSSKSNPPPGNYEWYRGNSKIKLKLQVQKIRVLNVSKDSELYSCVAINEVGRGESPATEIPVQYAAIGVQVVVLQPTEGVTELKCSYVSSRPNVTHYTWIKDGTSLLNETGQILVLDGHEDKLGSYSCIAHNTAGSSASAELNFKDSKDTKNITGDEDRPDLLLILGVLAGVILLLFLVMIVFFYARRKRKLTAQSSPVHGIIRPHFPNIRGHEETFVEEHHYGNIQVNPKVHPSYSFHAPEEQSHAIYSNEKVIQAETDIEYSTIAHSQHGRRQDLFTGDYEGDDISYAEILKKK